MSGNMTYKMFFDTPVGYRAEKSIQRRKGSYEFDSSKRYDKSFCLDVVRNLCDMYGPGTHWLEDETGEKVE